MFNVEGEYYCINGCFRYPLCYKNIFEFISRFSPNCIIEDAEYYKINVEKFNYDDAMNGFITEEKRREFSLTADFPYTLISADFSLLEMPCRLLLEFYDDEYYGISLLFGFEQSSSTTFKKDIIIPFYQIFKPIYGNNGVEKALYSLKQIDLMDCDIFNSEFMLNNSICNRIGIKYIKQASNAIIIENTGIFFPKQKKDVYELIFHKFTQTLK